MRFGLKMAKRAFQSLMVLGCFVWFSANASASDSAEVYQKGNWGLGFYGAGGKGVNGSTASTEVAWTGVHYKRIMSDVKGNGFWRGTFEYGAEFQPLFLIFQEETVYGFHFSPLLMRWNFQKPATHIVPFFEFGGGMLFTQDQVPKTSSRFNFTPQAGVGLSFFNGGGNGVTFQLKYMHISNAGIKKPNPGINSIQMLAGYEWIH
ncbi:MAG TPA: acyloxyacyl hydrolase [Acidobacteriota bacterium]